MTHNNDVPVSGESRGFLERWSSRKRHSKVATAPEQDVAEHHAEQPIVSITSQNLDSFDLSLLPQIENIGPDTDLAGWLAHAATPDSWKIAAFRQLWLTDPSVRDFKALADYALDWNTPGGAPGYGPLDVTDEMRQAVWDSIGNLPEYSASDINTEIHKDDTVIHNDDVQSEADKMNYQSHNLRVSMVELQDSKTDHELYVESASSETALIGEAIAQSAVATHERSSRRYGGALPSHEEN